MTQQGFKYYTLGIFIVNTICRLTFGKEMVRYGVRSDLSFKETKVNGINVTIFYPFYL